MTMLLLFLPLVILHFAAADKRDPYFKTLNIQSDVHYRFSTTLMTGELINPNRKKEKVTWDVILPEHFYISNLTVSIKDQSYYGNVVTHPGHSVSAKRQYVHPPSTSVFTLLLDVPADSSVKVSLVYQGLLQRSEGVYQHKTYLLPGQEVNRLNVDVNIEETRDITGLKVPPMMGAEQQATIKEITASSTRVIYSATKSQLNHLSKHVIGTFCVQYDIKRSPVSSEMLVSNGYFVQYLAFNKGLILPKDLVFVIDVSGSMQLTGMDKVKSVLHTILSDLRPNDKFALVFYNQKVRVWRDQLSTANKQAVNSAKQEINTYTPFGRSNINDALLKSLSLLKDSGKSRNSRAQGVIFLTDGVASEGELKTPRILNNVRKANTMNVPIYSIFLGDSNYDLVNQLSFQNQGVSYKISSSEYIPEKLKAFYERVTSILALQLKFKYDKSVLKTTLADFGTFRKGSEVIIAGSLSDKSISNIKSKLSYSNPNGLKQFEFESSRYPSASGKSKGFLTEADRQQIPEKVFAYLSTRQAVENTLHHSDAAEQEKWKEDAINLAVKHKYLTPLTSMEILKSKEKSVGHGEVNELFPSSTRTFGIYGKFGGGGGDPHFIMDIKGLSIPICFNAVGQPDQPMLLIDDPRTRTKVEASIIRGGHNKQHKTYMGEIRIVAPGLTLTATTKHVVINSKTMSWTTETTQALPTSDIINFGNGKNIAVRVGGQVEFEMKRILHSKKANKTDFLDFYVLNGNGLSLDTTGILGRLLNLRGHVRWSKKSLDGKMTAQLQISNQFSRKRINVPAVLKKRPDPLTTRKPCWMLWKKSYTQLALL
ncbi:inter-alpha-trypsin inhibitor heavy chain H3-like [Argonauta hians]